MRVLAFQSHGITMPSTVLTWYYIAKALNYFSHQTPRLKWLFLLRVRFSFYFLAVLHVTSCHFPNSPQSQWVKAGGLKTEIHRHCRKTIMITHLKNWDRTHSHENHYPNVHFGCQPSPVISVIVAVVLLRMIQHVVIVPAWFVILKDNKKSHTVLEASWWVRAPEAPEDLLINLRAKPYSVSLLSTCPKPNLIPFRGLHSKTSACLLNTSHCAVFLLLNPNVRPKLNIP